MQQIRFERLLSFCFLTGSFRLYQQNAQSFFTDSSFRLKDSAFDPVLKCSLQLLQPARFNGQLMLVKDFFLTSFIT